MASFAFPLTCCYYTLSLSVVAPSSYRGMTCRRRLPSFARFRVLFFSGVRGGRCELSLFIVLNVTDGTLRPRRRQRKVSKCGEIR